MLFRSLHLLDRRGPEPPCQSSVDGWRHIQVAISCSRLVGRCGHSPPAPLLHLSCTPGLGSHSPPGLMLVYSSFTPCVQELTASYLKGAGLTLPFGVFAACFRPGDTPCTLRSADGRVDVHGNVKMKLRDEHRAGESFSGVRRSLSSCQCMCMPAPCHPTLAAPSQHAASAQDAVVWPLAATPSS